MKSKPRTGRNDHGFVYAPDGSLGRSGPNHGDGESLKSHLRTRVPESPRLSGSGVPTPSRPDLNLSGGGDWSAHVNLVSESERFEVEGTDLLTRV